MRENLEKQWKVDLQLYNEVIIPSWQAECAEIDAVWASCKSTVFYRTPAPIIVYYFPYITCLLYLLFLIKHVRTSG